MRSLLAEAFGTFCLVFAGTGAIIINDVSGGSITHLGVALTFGLIVLAMIQTLGETSGCHLNPAVTIAFALARRFPRKNVALYILAQCLGAITASVLLRCLFPEHASLGATKPAGSALQSWVLEFVLSMMLMVVILSVSAGSKEKGLLAGISIGAVIALEALFAGPICGASMNPARSLAPALLSGHLQELWIYLTAPVLGTLFGVGVCAVIHKPGECCRPETP